MECTTLDELVQGMEKMSPVADGLVFTDHSVLWVPRSQLVVPD
jgi:hypothetical protein